MAADRRRAHRCDLPLEKKGEVVQARLEFQLLISCNLDYQNPMMALKQSTKQRFGDLDSDYSGAEVASEIAAHGSGIDGATAEKLVQVAQRSRSYPGHGLDEGVSMQLLNYAGQLFAKGIEPQVACKMALVRPLTDDPNRRDTLDVAVVTPL